MHAMFEIWSPDEVAECLDGVPESLYHKLWTFTGEQPENPQLKPENIENLTGRPDNFREYALKNFWGRLTQEEQELLNQLAETYSK